MTEDEARRNFVKMVYAPYKVEVELDEPTDLSKDEIPEDFYALIPAGVHSIVGEETFVDIINEGFGFTYDKAGNVLSDETYFPGLYVDDTTEYGSPYMEYDDHEGGTLYKFIPISWDEFPKNVLDALQDESSLVDDTAQIVRVYLDDFIKDRCAGKSPLDLYKYVDSTFFYEFFADVVKWAQALPSAL